jgi:Cys-rich repeat protein
MELTLGILQGLGIFAALPFLIGIIVVGPFLLRDSRASAKQDITTLVCSINADCPTGFVCIDGYCMPQIA